MRKNKNIVFFQKTYVFFSTLKKEGTSIGFSLYIYTHCIFTYFLDFFSDLQFEKKNNDDAMANLPSRQNSNIYAPPNGRHWHGPFCSGGLVGRVIQFILWPIFANR